MFGYKDTADVVWADTTNVIWHELGFYAGAGSISIVGFDLSMLRLAVPAVFDYGYKDTADVIWWDTADIVWAPLGIVALPGVVLISGYDASIVRKTLIVGSIEVESDSWSWKQLDSRNFEVRLENKKVLYFCDN